MPPNDAHAYEQNGLLTVNPTAQHPIIKLIEQAEAAWEAKLHRASRTLQEAVAEYRRRYKRYPPDGFDKWWKYVQDNNVLLPDEYDQIHRDLEPFWALDPMDLQKLVADEQAVVETFTIGKDKPGDHIAVVNHSFADPDHWREKNALRGAQDIIDLLKEVEDHLPPFRAVVSPMDNPMLLTDYASIHTLLQAVTRNQSSELPKPTPKNLRLACPPDSPAYQYGIDYTKPPPPPSQNASFIWNHGFAMDPCSHPSLFYQHGEYLGLDERHIPPQEEVAPSDDPEWEDKLDERISWRGRNTGIWFAEDGRWKSTQRTRLIQLASDLNGTVRVLVPKPDGFAVGPGRLVEKARLNPALFDMAFADQPIDCDDDICEELERMFEWRRPQSFTEAGKHKYIFDMDGDAWSSRFKRIITTKSLIFKATIYPEW
ncbi:hypothetical protein ONZ45_g14504 [Pleurotus djamor]|nr:hypothetical protein ONZ45_g14504 [Pleurotus djamor]